MHAFLLQIAPSQLLGAKSTTPELPPGPSLDNVRGPVEIPLLEIWQIVLIFLLATLVTGLIAWMILRYVRNRKHCTRKLPPAKTAMATLKFASEWAHCEDETFAVISSQALRHYFETNKDIDARGQTTNEFLKNLEKDASLSTDTHRMLADFLHRCDQVKFAQTALTVEERRALTKHALAIIHQSEQLDHTVSTE